MKTAMNATIQTPTRAPGTILLFFLLALPGCFSLSHGAPSQRYYVLGADGQAEREAQVQNPATDASVIGLRPPRLADYLASPFIVVRQGTHRIGFSEVERWGEELARGINRTLAGHVAARSPAHRVESAPWPPGARPDYLIQLHILRFEGVAPEDPLDSAGEAHLRASWQILGHTDGAVLVSGTTNVRSGGWTVGDFDGLVVLLNGALGTLADELVVGMERAGSLLVTPDQSRVGPAGRWWASPGVQERPGSHSSDGRSCVLPSNDRESTMTIDARKRHPESDPGGPCLAVRPARE